MDPSADILRKVRRTLLEHRMTRPGDRIIVGVSGGPDSVCLLHLLHRLGKSLRIELVAAHFDHGLRPEQDPEETRFVEDLAASMDIPVETGRAGMRIREKAGCLEEESRRARYRFLHGTAEKYRAQRIALGHHQNDQAETVLMRLLRGSGPAGLSGIPPLRDGTIIRPLLRVRREEILSYLEKTGLSFVTDPSNADPRFLRNRIRMELLPLLETYQPRVIERLARTAGIMREDEAFLVKTAQDWISRRAEIHDGADLRLPAAALAALPEALATRAVRCAVLKTAGTLRRVTRRHIDAVLRLAAGRKSQAATDLPNGIAVRRVYGTLVFSAGRPERPPAFHHDLEGPGTFYLEPPGCRVVLEEIPGPLSPKEHAAPGRALLDRDRIGYPLVIRNFRAGDRFIPLGMKGRRKLKDFFIDLKLPSGARASVPILLHRNRILWVGGLRIDDRFKVTPDTRNVLRVTITPMDRTGSASAGSRHP